MMRETSWPLAIERDGRVLWHVAGTNPPEYEADEKLEAIYMEAQQRLKAPFPYFGGKSKIVDLVWQHFGQVDNFVEPFFGSGAVLLGCPHPGHTETVNDADGLLANFWRAMRSTDRSACVMPTMPALCLNSKARPYNDNHPRARHLVILAWLVLPTRWPAPRRALDCARQWRHRGALCEGTARGFAATGSNRARCGSD
jgi:hypothetical protein